MWTDCPYQGPDKGIRNDPSTIPRGVRAIAAVRMNSVELAPIRQPVLPEVDVISSRSEDFVDTRSIRMAAMDEIITLKLDKEEEIVKNQIRFNFRTLFSL